MLITTKSGSTYDVHPSTHGPNGELPCLEAFRNGVDGKNWNAKCVAVYPDRVEPFMDSKSFEFDEQSGKLVGRNAGGTITCQFYADQVRPGMVLVNTKGFKSTVITRVQ